MIYLHTCSNAQKWTEQCTLGRERERERDEVKICTVFSIAYTWVNMCEYLDACVPFCISIHVLFYDILCIHTWMIFLEHLNTTTRLPLVFSLISPSAAGIPQKSDKESRTILRDKLIHCDQFTSESATLMVFSAWIPWGSAPGHAVKSGPFSRPDCLFWDGHRDISCCVVCSSCWFPFSEFDTKSCLWHV